MSLKSGDLTSLGKRIRYAREQQREKQGQFMSRKTLGRAIGRSGRTIQRWEADETQPSSKHLAHVAQVLGCRLAWLEAGDDPMWGESTEAQVEEPLHAYQLPSSLAPATQTFPLLSVRSGEDELVSVHLMIRVHQQPKTIDVEAPKK